MINMIQNYLIFPKRLGFYPYFWCIFLAYPVIAAFQQPLPTRLLVLGLTVVFYLTYRQLYTIDEPGLTVCLLSQYAISIGLTFLADDIFIFLFAGFELGMQSMPKKRFYGWYLLYACCILIPLLVVGLFQSRLAQVFGIGNSTQTMESLVWLTFLLLAPKVSRSLNESMARWRQAAQTNQRVANSIRRGERDRIARDLHDTLGQSFSMITIKTELAEKLLTKAPDKVATELHDIETTSRANLQLVRDIVSDLRRPTITDTLILQEQNLRTAGIILITENEEVVPKIPESSQQIFSAILTEAIMNLIRYSQSRDCQITFAITATDYQVTIRDHGVGLTKQRENSHGLVGMAERLGGAGGKLQIKGQPGVTITATLPKKETTEND